MNPMKEKWKKYLDNFLVANLFLIIVGAFLFISSILANLKGWQDPYQFFQALWYPLFIPALSLFFTAILIEASISRLLNQDRK